MDRQMNTRIIKKKNNGKFKGRCSETKASENQTHKIRIIKRIMVMSAKREKK